MKHEPYPLEWPPSWPRTPSHRRRDGQLNRNWTLARARDDLLAELDRLQARSVVISTNLELRVDGLPKSGQREPGDPGVAAYFRRLGQERWYALACDRYPRVALNMRALTLTIDSMRRIERHGSSHLLEQALSGFTALPAAIELDPPWWDVLGVPEYETDHEVIELAYRGLVELHHPDRSRSPDATKKMAQINVARDKALASLGVR